MTTIVKQDLVESNEGFAAPSRTHANELNEFLGRRFNHSIKLPPEFRFSTPAESMKKLMKGSGFTAEADLVPLPGGGSFDPDSTFARSYWGLAIPDNLSLADNDYDFPMGYKSVPDFSAISLDTNISLFSPRTSLSRDYSNPDSRASANASMPQNNGNGSLIDPKESTLKNRSRFSFSSAEDGIMPSFGNLPVLNRSVAPGEEDYHPVADSSPGIVDEDESII